MSENESYFDQEASRLARTHTGQFVAGLEVGLEVVEEQRKRGELQTKDDQEQAIVIAMNRVQSKHIEGEGLTEDEKHVLVTGSQAAVDEAFIRERAEQWAAE